MRELRLHARLRRLIGQTVGPSGGVLATTLTPNMTADTKIDKESLAKCYGFGPFLFYKDRNSKGNVKRKLSYTLVTAFAKN